MVRHLPHIPRWTEDFTTDLSPFKGCPRSRTIIGFHCPQDKTYTLVLELGVDSAVPGVPSGMVSSLFQKHQSPHLLGKQHGPSRLSSIHSAPRSFLGFSHPRRSLAHQQVQGLRVHKALAHRTSHSTLLASLEKGCYLLMSKLRPREEAS